MSSTNTRCPFPFYGDTSTSDCHQTIAQAGGSSYIVYLSVWLVIGVSLFTATACQFIRLLWIRGYSWRVATTSYLHQIYAVSLLNSVCIMIRQIDPNNWAGRFDYTAHNTLRALSSWASYGLVLSCVCSWFKLVRHISGQSRSIHRITIFERTVLWLTLVWWIICGVVGGMDTTDRTQVVESLFSIVYNVIMLCVAWTLGWRIYVHLHQYQSLQPTTINPVGPNSRGLSKSTHAGTGTPGLSPLPTPVQTPRNMQTGQGQTAAEKGDTSSHEPSQHPTPSRPATNMDPTQRLSHSIPIPYVKSQSHSNATVLHVDQTRTRIVARRIIQLLIFITLVSVWGGVFKIMFIIDTLQNHYDRATNPEPYPEWSGTGMVKASADTIAQTLSSLCVLLFLRRFHRVKPSDASSHHVGTKNPSHVTLRVGTRESVTPVGLPTVGLPATTQATVGITDPDIYPTHVYELFTTVSARTSHGHMSMEMFTVPTIGHGTTPSLALVPAPAPPPMHPRASSYRSLLGVSGSGSGSPPSPRLDARVVSTHVSPPIFACELAPTTRSHMDSPRSQSSRLHSRVRPAINHI